MWLVIWIGYRLGLLIRRREQCEIFRALSRCTEGPDDSTVVTVYSPGAAVMS